MGNFASQCSLRHNARRQSLIAGCLYAVYWLHHWSLGIDKQFHPAFCNGRIYLPMPGFKLIYVSKRVPVGDERRAGFCSGADNVFRTLPEIRLHCAVRSHYWMPGVTNCIKMYQLSLCMKTKYREKRLLIKRPLWCVEWFGTLVCPPSNTLSSHCVNQLLSL